MTGTPEMLCLEDSVLGAADPLLREQPVAGFAQVLRRAGARAARDAGGGRVRESQGQLSGGRSLRRRSLTCRIGAPTLRLGKAGETGASRPRHAVPRRGRLSGFIVGGRHSPRRPQSE